MTRQREGDRETPDRECKLGGCNKWGEVPIERECRYVGRNELRGCVPRSRNRDRFSRRFLGNHSRVGRSAADHSDAERALSEPTAGSMARGSSLAALPAAVLRRPTWPTGRSSAAASQFPLRSGMSAPAGPSMPRSPTIEPPDLPTDRPRPHNPVGELRPPRSVSAKRFRTRTWHRQPVGPAQRVRAARTNPPASSALPVSRPWGLAMDRLLEMPASPY